MLLLRLCAFASVQCAIAVVVADFEHTENFRKPLLPFAREILSKGPAGTMF